MTSRLRKRTLACLVLSALTVIHAPAQTRPYDLLLHGGHVIDDKNKVDSLMDVAISNGRIAKLAPHISSTEALKTIDVTGLYVTAGLIDLHVHVFAGTGEPGSYAGDESIYPDGFTFRNGVTTVVDAGSPGWRSFERFHQHVIAGNRVHIPVMIDFGADQPARPLYDLLNKKLRPGDIYTHMYSGLRHEQDPVTKGPSQAFIDGRKRGIFFDTGTGGGSFNWTIAIPMVKAGFLPDSISTDLHAGSMNSATKDML